MSKNKCMLISLSAAILFATLHRPRIPNPKK